MRAALHLEAFENALADVDGWDRRAEQVFTPCGEGRMVWRGWGEGRSVVLLHGGAGSWRHWIRNLPVLTERFRIWAPDMPGLGDSAVPPEPWSPRTSAEIIVTGLDHVIPAGEAFDLVGFSAGAMIAGLVAAQMKARCRTLVLVGAGSLGTGRAQISLEKVRSKQGKARWQAHHANLERLMVADPARIDAQALAIQDWNSAHTRVSSVEFASSTLLRDAIAAGRGPLKAIWGSEDAVARTTLAERCRILQSLRPGVDVRVIPGAGHWVAYEAANAFNETLVDLLDGVA